MAAIIRKLVVSAPWKWFG